MQMHPELWAHAMPPEVVIVRRDALENSLKLSADLVTHLADDGAHVVAVLAARRLHEAEEKERANR